MPDVIYKVLANCEVKKIGERQYEFIASTSTQDRDGEVIDAAGWDLNNFKKNPVIMYGHDYTSLPIGRASKVWLHGGKLKDIVEFPPEGTYEFADIVARLVDTGYLKTQSVGFIPKKWEDGDGTKAPKRLYTKQELLEISIVPIPSNPDALREAVATGVITTKQLEVITKPEEADEFIRIPVDSGNHEGHRIRTISISEKEGISALYCGTDKVVMTYLFEKSKGWDMAKAKAWVKEHEGKSIGELTEHKTSQEEIIDEIDYLKSLIETEGLGFLVRGPALQLASQIILTLKEFKIPDELVSYFKGRLSGSDMPCVEKIKATPELTNQDILEAIKRLSKGGEGSGNFGHEGRPGEVGGSGEGGGGGNDKPSEDNYTKDPPLSGRRINGLDKPAIGDVFSDNGEHFMFLQNATNNPSKQGELLIGTKSHIIRLEATRKVGNVFHSNIVNDYADRDHMEGLLKKWNSYHPEGGWTPDDVNAMLQNNRRTKR